MIATTLYTIATLALANAARLSIAKACVRTAKIIRKGAAKVRCTFAS